MIENDSIDFFVNKIMVGTSNGGNWSINQSICFLHNIACNRFCLLQKIAQFGFCFLHKITQS